MKRIHLCLVVAASVVLAACSAGNQIAGPMDHNTSASAPSGPAAPGGPARYIVGLSPRAAVTDITALTSTLSAPPLFTYSTALKGFAAVLSPAEKARLAADPRVSYVEPDLPVMIFAQSLPWGVNRIDAEQNTGSGGSGIGVAVIDTGIDLSHPDLAGGVTNGYNFVQPNKSANDDNGHGTHVAGIIAARNNSIGVVGVAPQCTVIAVKVLDRFGSGYISTVVAGVNWVAAHQAGYNIKVANMSLGAQGSSQSLQNAITGATNAGVTFVVAAGNSFADASSFIPASYPNVICVSALNQSDGFAYFSNYGSVVDVIAPGVSIPSLYKNKGYATMSGTSMASPHVAGAAALWFDNHSGGFTDVYNALTSGGEYGTWLGDPDGTYEPLVDAQPL
jgi:subtilisin family serine protease